MDGQVVDAYVRARGAALFRVAYLLCGDHHLAEDLVQSALLRTAGHWRQLVASGDPDAYVRRVLYHQHVSSSRQPATPGAGSTVDAPPPPSADRSDEVIVALAVRQALARLGPRQRAVLVLRYFEDLSESRTAEVLGIGLGTVKSQTRDGLARLRALAPELARELDPEVSP